MSHLKIYGPCLDCGLREFKECEIKYFDKDFPSEFGPSTRHEICCMKEPVCKLIEGLEPFKHERGE